MRKILIIIGVILAASVILIVGTHLYMELSDTTCSDCQPFTGAAVREGDNLLLVIRHVPCAPTACHPVGSYADGIRSVNISVTSDDGRQFFVEQPVMLHETNTFPEVLANSSSARVRVSVDYAGWKNQSYNLTLVDDRI